MYVLEKKIVIFTQDLQILEYNNNFIMKLLLLSNYIGNKVHKFRFKPIKCYYYERLQRNWR